MSLDDVVRFVWFYTFLLGAFVAEIGRSDPAFKLDGLVSPLTVSTAAQLPKYCHLHSKLF